MFEQWVVKCACKNIHFKHTFLKESIKYSTLKIDRNVGLDWGQAWLENHFAHGLLQPFGGGLYVTNRVKSHQSFPQLGVGGTGEAWRFGFNFAYVEDDGREGANGGCGGRGGGGWEEFNKGFEGGGVNSSLLSNG